jgi:glycerate kinase
MQILIAADSFKDALSSLEVCRAIERGVRLASPSAQTTVFPLADGGEGTTEVLAYHLKGRVVEVWVHDPLARQVEAQYLLSEDGRTAFIEMAQASGLQRLAYPERNVLETSTFGTGELIADAMKKGAQKILLAIGGSATNDVGMGMAAALGWRFFSKNGDPLAPAGKNLVRVQRIVPPDFLPETTVEVLRDVDNPLTGEKGAVHTYARQKGASMADMIELEKGGLHFSKCLEAHFGKNFDGIPGAGAAGGLGAGAMAFLNAKLRPGTQAILDLTNFETYLKTADLVITGEGRLDRQTLHGKLVHGIARRATDFGVPAIALCGAVEATPADVGRIGLLAAFSCAHKPQSLEQALPHTAQALESLAFNVLKAMGKGL